MEDGFIRTRGKEEVRREIATKKKESKTGVLKNSIFAILEEPPCQGCQYMEKLLAPHCYRGVCIIEGHRSEQNDIKDCLWITSILEACQKAGMVFWTGATEALFVEDLDLT